MQIIGWKRKGNVVRFIFGDNNPDDQNAALCEYNTSITSGEKRHVDFAFNYDVSVMEANVDNSFCMNDFKDRKIPILIIDFTGEERWYSECISKKHVYKIYMGDSYKALVSALEQAGGIKILDSEIELFGLSLFE